LQLAQQAGREPHSITEERANTDDVDESSENRNRWTFVPFAKTDSKQALNFNLGLEMAGLGNEKEEENQELGITVI
jgi:hypothetical protein